MGCCVLNPVKSHSERTIRHTSKKYFDDYSYLSDRITEIMDKKQAKLEIEKLVEKCRRIKSNRSTFISYDEANTRKDLIMPLFECLGWDVFNDFYNREVIEEDSAIEGRVDYSFNINGIPKFLLEAKALKVDLDKAEWAKQAVTYGWNKGISWVILTDFEGLKIFNSDWRIDEPRPNLEFSFEEYLTRFDDLWLLSRELIEKGELDKLAAKWGITAKRIKVSEKLAKDLVMWRELLARNFKQWNEGLSDTVIDEAVQRILDRLIFIRVTEDRGLEQKVLWQMLHQWLAHERRPYNFMQELKPLFREFDKKYNSSLFQPHICEELETEGLPFEKIINDLYSGKEGGVKYRFDAIDSDVLGSIYEQYLGHVQQKRSKTTEGDERKKQGIYYTPSYIVNFMVESTLGKAIKGKSLNEIDEIKVLDPACGSGSFLIKAFDVLDAYIKDKRDDNRSADPLRRFEILTKNIYGVDLDGQAIEIARLNLLLKALAPGLKLPNLTANIKEGNSLIPEGDKKLKPFNWQKEYKEVFNKGGFDVIIGNPPYIKEYTNKSAFNELHNSPYYQGKMDIWTLFGCVAIDLLKDGGYLSLIAPNNWLTNAGASIFRDKILSEGQIIDFIDFGDFKVFKEAGIQTMIFVFRKNRPEKNYKVSYAKINDKNIKESAVNALLQSNLKLASNEVTVLDTVIEPGQLVGENISFTSQTVDLILNQIESKKNFELTKKEVANGIHPHYDFVNKAISAKHGNKFKVGEGIFGLTGEEKEDLPLSKEENNLIKPYFTTKQLGRYYADRNNTLWLIYTDSKFKNPDEMKLYPNIKAHLDRFKNVITSDNKPYGLHRARKENFFIGEKIIALRKCTNRPVFTYTDFNCYVSATFYVIKTKRLNQKYLIGLLNSSLIKYWLKNKGKMQGDNFQIDKEPLLSLPLIKPDEKIQNEIALLVEKVISLYQNFRNTSTNTDKWYYLKNEIKELEQKIDQETYKLYELSEKEIEVVEGNNESNLR